MLIKLDEYYLVLRNEPLDDNEGKRWDALFEIARCLGTTTMRYATSAFLAEQILVYYGKESIGPIIHACSGNADHADDLEKVMRKIYETK